MSGVRLVSLYGLYESINSEAGNNPIAKGRQRMYRVAKLGQLMGDGGGGEGRGVAVAGCALLS
jgi:hypothetical protein